MLPIEGGWGDVTATTSRAAIAERWEIAAHGGLVPRNLAFFSRGGSSQVAPFYQRARRALSGLDIPSCRSWAAFSQLRGQAAACSCGRNRAIRPFRSQRQLRDERL